MAIYKLGDIAILKSGSTPSRKNNQFWLNGDLKWLSSGEVAPNVCNSKEKINSITTKKVPFLKNSVLMAMYGATAGKVGYLGKNMFVNQAICVFNSYKNICLNKYLYYVLENISPKIQKLAIGGAQQNLSINIISKFKIEISSLKTQKQIIDIIEPIDCLISNVNNQKNVVKKSLNFILNKLIGNEWILIKDLIDIRKNNISNNLLSCGIGMNGLIKNNSKVKKLKKIFIYDIGIGYVRHKHIDIGYNFDVLNAGVSVAYKVLFSNKNPLASYFIYDWINKNYSKLSKSSARGTGGLNYDLLMNSKIFLNEELLEYFNPIFIKLINISTKINKNLENLLQIKKNLLNKFIKI